jgi:hypothetical protein
MRRDELIAIFEAEAESPPSKQNELLVRHLKCKEALYVTAAVSGAISRYRSQNAETIRVPSELLPPLG